VTDKVKQCARGKYEQSKKVRANRNENCQIIKLEHRLQIIIYCLPPSHWSTTPSRWSTTTRPASPP